jgi:hypothetical protein
MDLAGLRKEAPLFRRLLAYARKMPWMPKGMATSHPGETCRGHLRQNRSRPDTLPGSKRHRVSQRSYGSSSILAGCSTKCMNKAPPVNKPEAKTASNSKTVFIRVYLLSSCNRRQKFLLIITYAKFPRAYRKTGSNLHGTCRGFLPLERPHDRESF